MEKPYKSSYGHDGKYYVDGPSDGGGCSYYGGTLYPNMRMDTKEEADRFVIFANIGFQEGYKKAQQEMRAALGIKD